MSAGRKYENLNNTHTCRLSYRNEEPDVGAKRRRLSVSNGRLCADACEKIPIMFDNSVDLFNKILMSFLVYMGVHFDVFHRTPPKRHRLRPRGCLWRPRICTFVHLSSRPKPV